MTALSVGGIVLLGFLFRPDVRGIDRIAVLPLASDRVGGETWGEEQQVFVDGMHDGLIRALGRLDRIDVLSRDSVARYRDTTLGIAAIGAELGVNGVIQGAVSRSGDTIRLSVELLRVDPEERVGSASYEGGLEDALNLQRRIARAIADAVQDVTTQAGLDRLAERPPVDPRALEAYLRGRFHLRDRTPDGVDRALATFEETIGIQPDLAEAHAGLAMARCLAALSRRQTLTPEEYARQLDLGRETAAKALELDPDLAEAHAVWGYSAQPGSNPIERIRALRRAIEIDPSYAQAHTWLGDVYAHQGRTEEAAAARRRSRELDPSSP